MCRLAGKQFSDFLVSDHGNYLATLSYSTETATIQSVLNGPVEVQGNYVHLVVALYLARWCSEEMGRAFSAIASFGSPRSQIAVEHTLFRAIVSKQRDDRPISSPSDKSSLVADASIWYERLKPILLRVGRPLRAMSTWVISLSLSLIAYVLAMPRAVFALGAVIVVVAVGWIAIAWIKSRPARLVPNRTNVDMSLLVASARNAMQPRPIITRMPSTLAPDLAQVIVTPIRASTIIDPALAVESATASLIVKSAMITPDKSISSPNPTIYDYFLDNNANSNVRSSVAWDIRVCRFIRPVDQQDTIQDRGKNYIYFASVKSMDRTKCPLFLSNVRKDLISRKRIQMVGSDRWCFKLMNDCTPKLFVNAIVTERRKSSA